MTEINKLFKITCYFLYSILQQIYKKDKYKQTISKTYNFVY